MGTISFTITQGTPAFTGTKTYTVADADLIRFFNWAETYYASRPFPLNLSDSSPTPLTKGQAAVAWAKDVLIEQTLPKIIEFEKQMSIKNLPSSPSISAT